MKTTEKIIKENVRLDNVSMSYKIINKNNKWYSEEEYNELLDVIRDTNEIIKDCDHIIK